MGSCVICCCVHEGGAWGAQIHYHASCTGSNATRTLPVYKIVLASVLNPFVRIVNVSPRFIHHSVPEWLRDTHKRRLSQFISDGL